MPIHNEHKIIADLANALRPVIDEPMQVLAFVGEFACIKCGKISFETPHQDSHHESCPIVAARKVLEKYGL